MLFICCTNIALPCPCSPIARKTVILLEAHFSSKFLLILFYLWYFSQCLFEKITTCYTISIRLAISKRVVLKVRLATTRCCYTMEKAVIKLSWSSYKHLKAPNTTFDSNIVHQSIKKKISKNRLRSFCLPAPHFLKQRDSRHLGWFTA